MNFFPRADSKMNHGQMSFIEQIKLFIKQHFWTLLSLIIASLACLAIIKIFKKPGQMSVIESQAMDMTSMVPPTGVMPVAVYKVKVKEIEGSITYTGTVQAYEDEDVYPRVTGYIEKMPSYPGDLIKKGSLIVQLDPSKMSEYKAKLEGSVGALHGAMHNEGTAYSQLDETKYNLNAAVQNEESSKEALNEALAKLEYLQQDINRQEQLLKQEVISLDEYQKELSKLKSTKASVEQKKAKVKQAAYLRLSAKAAYTAAKKHVEHLCSEVTQAKANLENATIYDKYTKIFAKDDIVVTKRLISPGVVVSPGMLILKLAYVNKVRVQASVASQDAMVLHIGDTVYLKSAEDNTNTFKSKITSIFPSADPASRTFTVESLIDNRKRISGKLQVNDLYKLSKLSNYWFMPGQYVIMQIITGSKLGLVVPSNTIIYENGSTKVWVVANGISSLKPKYTCIMHPEVILNKPGLCPKCGMNLEPKSTVTNKVAKLVTVKLGLSNSKFTEIKSGIQEGDYVITSGSENLTPNCPIMIKAWNTSKVL